MDANTLAQMLVVANRVRRPPQGVSPELPVTPKKIPLPVQPSIPITPPITATAGIKVPGMDELAQQRRADWGELRPPTTSEATRIEAMPELPDKIAQDIALEKRRQETMAQYPPYVSPAEQKVITAQGILRPGRTIPSLVAAAPVAVGMEVGARPQRALKQLSAPGTWQEKVEYALREISPEVRPGEKPDIKSWRHYAKEAGWPDWARSALLGTGGELILDPLVFGNLVGKVGMESTIKLAQLAKNKGIPIVRESIPKLREALAVVEQEARTGLKAIGETVTPQGVAGESGEVLIPRKPAGVSKIPAVEAKAAQAIPKELEFRPIGDTPEQIAWQKEYERIAKKTTLAEKTPQEGNTTPIEKLKEGEWEAFSKLRGYTDTEIADYKKMMDSAKKGEALGIPEDYIFGLDIEIREKYLSPERLAQMNEWANKVKPTPQIPPATPKTAPPAQSLGAGKGIVPPGEKPPVPVPEPGIPPLPPKPPITLPAAPPPPPSKPTVPNTVTGVNINRQGDKIFITDPISFTPEPKATFAQRLRALPKTLQELYAQTIDRMNPIVKFTKQVKATPEGAKLLSRLPGYNPSLLATRYLGIKGIVDAKIFKGTHRLTPEGNIEWIGKSLADVLGPMKDNLDDMMRFMVAQRDIELSKRILPGGRPIVGTHPVESALQIEQLNAKYGAGFFDVASAELRKWTKEAMLDPMVDIGAISKETYQGILKSNEFYIPFNRVMDDLEKSGAIPKTKDLFTPGGLPIKGIKGSERQIINPLEQMITNLYKVTDFVERERVTKAVVGMRIIPGMETIIKPVDAKWIPVKEIVLKAEIDNDFMGQLIGFAKGLGLKGFETGGAIRGRNLGVYRPATQEITRRFGTSSQTSAHEVGHFFDSKYGLKERFAKIGGFQQKSVEKLIKEGAKTEAGKISGEKLILRRDLANELSDYSYDKRGSPINMNTGEPRKIKLEERFADAFQFWLVHRNWAEERIPLFSQEMTKIISEIPDLKGVLNIKSTPHQNVERMNQMIFARSPFAPGRNVVGVFENGRKNWYEVPEDLYGSLTGLRETDIGIITKILSQPAKLLRTGATLSLEFMGRNPIRDQWTSFVQSKYGYIPGYDFVKGLFSNVKRDDLYWKYMASGAGHSNFVSLDRISSQKTLQDVLGKSIGRKTKDLVLSPLDALRAISEVGEQGTRVGLYGRAKKAGISDIEAMLEAKDTTLNFARRGTATRAVNQIIAFFNANVQGTDKMVRVFKDRPGMTSLKAIAGITLPTITLYALNRNNPRYQELPQWRKDLFWNIPVGETGPIISIPKPFTLGYVFGAVPERILTWIDKDDPKALSGLAQSAAETLNPGFIPTLLNPIIENTTDYSFFKKTPIVGPAMKRLPPEMQKDIYTPEVFSELGKITGMSPLKMENLYNGYTAGLGRLGIDFADWVLKQAGITDPAPKPEKTASDIPFVRGFVAREPQGSGSESVNRFYDVAESIDSHFAGVKELLKQGHKAEAQEYAVKYPEIKHYQYLTVKKKVLSEIRNQRNKVMKDPNMDPATKRKVIDKYEKMMTEEAQKALVKLGFPVGGVKTKIFSPDELIEYMRQKKELQEAK